MANKRIFYLLTVPLAVFALLGSGFYLGLRTGSAKPEVVIAKGVANIDNQPPADFRTFWQAWKEIDDSYLRSDKVDAQTRVYGAIKGLVSSLGDPYSEFFTPEEGRRFEEQVQGNFGGIGAELGVRKGQLTVIAPLKDSPASKQGLRAGDMIFKINSTSTEGLAVDEAVNFIRGPEGTKVTLNVYREGWPSPKDVVITREKIEVPTVDLEMKDKIAHVSLYNFNANVHKELYNALRAAADKGAEGLILDLRDDPGGYLEVAVDTAGWFLKPGTLVVSENNKNGPVDTFKAEGNGALAGFPVAVLINKGSASASEILAGALRDSAKVPLIGETSYGKGTVQQLKTLPDGSQMKITIAHWVLPSGHILENGGLKPDYEVKLSEDDITNKRDPQLDKALEVVKSLIKK